MVLRLTKQQAIRLRSLILDSQLTLYRPTSVEINNRFEHIQMFFVENPGASQNDAVTFIPETIYMVSKYINRKRK